MSGIETALVSADTEMLGAFYASVFGLREEWCVDLVGEDFAAVGLGSPCEVKCLRAADGHRLKLLGPARSPRTATRTAPVIDTAGRALISMIVDDLDDVTARVLAAGGAPLGDGRVVQTKPTVRIAFVTDPEGNALELIERRR